MASATSTTSIKEDGRLGMIPTFKGAVGKDYPFWKVRVTHYLEQWGLLHCLDRIPPMEDCGDTRIDALSEEAALNAAKYQQRLKEDDEVVNVFWLSLDNDAMAHVMECVYAHFLDRLDSVYLRHVRLALFNIRRKLYNLRTAGHRTLMKLFMAHERYVQQKERTGDVISASEKLNTLLVAIPEKHTTILDAITVMRH